MYVTVACRGAGVLQTWLWLRDSSRSSETAIGQASVCAERCCTTDFHSSSSRPRPASTSQPTLASSPRKDFVPAGGASVSLSPRLCTWLPGVRSAAHLRPQHTSATVPSRRLLHLFGTGCQSQFWLRHHCQSSVVDWRLCFSLGLIAAPTRTMSSASTILRALFILLRVLAVFGLYATLKELRSSCKFTLCCRHQIKLTTNFITSNTATFTLWAYNKELKGTV